MVRIKVLESFEEIINLYYSQAIPKRFQIRSEY